MLWIWFLEMMSLAWAKQASVIWEIRCSSELILLLKMCAGLLSKLTIGVSEIGLENFGHPRKYGRNLDAQLVV